MRRKFKFIINNCVKVSGLADPCDSSISRRSCILTFVSHADSGPTSIIFDVYIQRTVRKSFGQCLLLTTCHHSNGYDSVEIIMDFVQIVNNLLPGRGPYWLQSKAVQSLFAVLCIWKLTAKSCIFFILWKSFLLTLYNFLFVYQITLCHSLYHLFWISLE